MSHRCSKVLARATVLRPERRCTAEAVSEVSLDGGFTWLKRCGNHDGHRRKTGRWPRRRLLGAP